MPNTSGNIIRKAVNEEQQRQLDDAIFIAVTIHHGQFDKGNKPYILHPLHVMNDLLWDPVLATIGVLHDAIEDSGGKLTIQILREKWNMSERVLEALSLLTRHRGQDYINEYIAGIATNIDAVYVKRRDLKHNSDITRLQGLSEKDNIRIVKYNTAYVILSIAKRKLTAGME